MKKENFDDIEALLSQDIELPEGLSKENIVRKLKNSDAAEKEKEQELKAEPKKNNVRMFRRIAASAAAFAVVLTGAVAVYRSGYGFKKPVSTVPATAQQILADVNTTKQATMQNSRNEQKEENTTAPTTQNNEKISVYEMTETTEPEEPTYKALDLGLKKRSLSSFKSEKDLQNYFENISKKYQANERYNEIAKDVFSGIGVEENAAAAPSMPAGVGTADASTDSSAHAETNTQVEGVDEGDIIKTDGRYIYVARGGYLSIIDGETMKLASQKKLRAAAKENDICINEIYVDGNRLVMVCEEYGALGGQGVAVEYSVSSYDCCFIRKRSCVAIVWDITDRENPKQLRRVTQDGNVVASRMVGTFLYIATSYIPELGTEAGEFTPKVNGQKLTCDEVYVENVKDECSEYIVLSGFDTANAQSEVSRVSVLGGSWEDYCSADTFYLSVGEYDSKKDREYTVVHAFSIRNGVVSYKGSGSVPGSCYGQYMMDQNGKYFRIATTGYDSGRDEDYTSLYVLDEKLNVIGRLEDIAKDEQLKSTRFMGDTAYIVTFRNTDPLFAVDLSKPDEPKLLGEVKLPGFSQYLHPLSENLLIGVGYDGDDESADFSTLKVSLFDVSNKRKPKELSSCVVSDCYYNVNSANAKEFVMLDENTFAIPLTVSEGNGKNDDYRQRYVFKTFTVRDNKIVEKKSYNHGVVKGYDGYGFFRGTFIADKVFTVDSKTVKKFDMNSARLLSALDYAPEEENKDGIAQGFTQVYNGAFAID